MNYLALLPVALAAGYAVGYVHGRRSGARLAAWMWVRNTMHNNTVRVQEAIKNTKDPKEKFKL